MPALIHNSEAFVTQGISLVSQSAQEEASGLVRVSVNYAVTQARSVSLSSLFYLDAPPPIFPNVVRKEDLQSRQLFLESHTAEKAFGQWIVQASYVGAKILRGNFGGLINRDAEARVTPPIKFEAGYDFSDDEVPQIIPAYDVVSVKFIAQTITRSIAGAPAPFFDLEAISADASGFIYRAEYGTISRSSPTVRTRFGYPSPDRILKSFQPALNISTTINNVTNFVIVATTVQQVVFDNPGGSVDL